MSLISSALATIKKGSSALDKNEVEKGIVKSYKKESAKKFVGGGSNTEVGIKIVSRNIKKSKVGKGVGYSNIVNQLNGILATTDGIKNTLLTDYANEVKKNRAEKRISNAEKRRKREDNLESKSNKKGKGFSVPGFISKPASSIFDWILNFFGMTILGSLVNLGLDNFDNIAKFFKDITGFGSGGGSGGGLNLGNIFWSIRAALYKLAIPKFFIKSALRGLGLLLSPLKLITAPFRIVGGLIFNTLKFVGNTLFNWTSKIVNLVKNIGKGVLPRLGSAFRNLFPGSSKITPGGSSGTGKSSRPGKTSPFGRSKGGGRIQTLHGHSAADLYENSYKNAIANGKSPTDAARRANADVKKALKKGRIVSKPQTGSLAGGTRGSNVFKGGLKPNRMIAKIFGKGPAKFLASNAKVFSQFGKVFKFAGGFAKRIPVIGPLMVAAISLLDPTENIQQTLFKTIGTALGGAIGTFIPIPIVGMVMGEMIGGFVGDLLYEGMMGKGWDAAGKRLMDKLKGLLQGGKEALEWVGGGASRFYEALPKIKIPDFPKDPPGVLKDIPFIGRFLGGSWEKLKIALKVMLGPLSLLMGKEIPDIGFFLDFNNFLGGPLLLKSFFPDGFVNTMKSAATSIFGMEGGDESYSETSYSQSTGELQNLSGIEGGKLKLTNEDWEYITRTVQGEAGPDDDQYYVAAAIINRMTDPRWYGANASAKTVVSASGQFAGYHEGARIEKSQYDRLTSKKGQEKIIQALEKLQGRTDFKGIAMYHNMGKGDIRPNDRSNFYHYLEQKTKSDQFDSSMKRDHWKGLVDNNSTPSPGNSSSIKGSSSRSSSPSSVSTYASYEKGGDDSNTIVVTLPDRYYQSGSESSSLPILAMDSKSILNSYYKSQLVGFLYKQG